MRLLSEDQQKLIWDSLYGALSDSSSYPFIIKRENLRTIDGKSEAYYAAIAANFIAGTIGVDLMFVNHFPSLVLLLTHPSQTQWQHDWST
jgi:hypothetical protein